MVAKRITIATAIWKYTDPLIANSRNPEMGSLFMATPPPVGEYFHHPTVPSPKHV